MANKAIVIAGRIQEKSTNFANQGQSLFLFLIRLYIGYQCLVAGWGHLHNIDGTADFFTSLHIPMPKASVIIAGTAELVGGIFLVFGILSRLTALVLTFNFLVAMLSVALSHHDFSWAKLWPAIWDDQDIVLKDTAFPFFATALIVLIFGPGWISVDGVVRRWRGGAGAQRP